MNSNIFGIPGDTITEPTSWARTQGAARYRQALLVGAPTLYAGGSVVIPIGRSGLADPIEDRTCDRCRHYSHPDELFYPFKLVYAVPGGGTVYVVGGLCADCAAKENPTLTRKEPAS